MPAIPARTPRPSGSQPADAGQVARSFGAEAGRYDRARPGYPDELVAAIMAASPGPRVLDVGCGTGISSRRFQAAGCEVLGIDPDARMAEVARQHGIAVEISSIEDWDPARRTFDIVVAGQAWHWVDPLAGAVKAGQALRPGGRLAPFWNVFQPPPDLAAAFAAVYGRVLPDLPVNLWARPALDAYAGVFRTVGDGIRRADGFGQPEQWRFDWACDYTRDEWLDQVPTQGNQHRLPPAQLEELLAGIGAAIDAVGGRFTMGYAAIVVTAQRAGP
ncbi:MAG: class I SAM-dependent methyltransferase [Streptosporangiaceae bacterium]